jgi:putative transposase
MSSFFGALKSYKQNPTKFNGRPKLPKYLNKTNGRFVVFYTSEAINHRTYKKDGIITLSKTNISLKPQVSLSQIKEISLSKTNNGYVLNVCYETEEIVKEYKISEKNGKKIRLKQPEHKFIKVDKPIKYAGIDLGVNNLATLTFQHTDNPLIYNGRVLKSINHGWKKRNANLKSLLNQEIGEYSSNKIRREIDKRANRVGDYLHKVSSDLVNQLVSRDVTDLVIGYNSGWKQDIKLYNNQNFVYIPYLKFVNMLKYKCFLKGIEIHITEESYTSICSFIDNEKVCFHESYLGNRKHRGLFISKSGLKINADVNGSYNIIRKVVPNFIYEKGIVALCHRIINI